MKYVEEELALWTLPPMRYEPPGQAETGYIRFRNHRSRAQPRLHQRHLACFMLFQRFQCFRLSDTCVCVIISLRNAVCVWVVKGAEMGTYHPLSLNFPRKP